MLSIPPPVGLGRDSAKRRAAREALARVLWHDDGRRRLPGERALVDAINACDRRDVWWVCEASSAGPVYFLPTRAWINELARFVDDNGFKSVLEICAGDGFLSACLKKVRPKLKVRAVDDMSWSDPAARMNDADRAERGSVAFAGIKMGAHVEKQAAITAVKEQQPDLVIAAWAPPGDLVDRVIKADSALVLDISVEGDVCGNGMATWRFEKDFIDGPLESKALCRLDERPGERRHSTMTVYYGRRHPLFNEEKQRAQKK